MDDKSRIDEFIEELLTIVRDPKSYRDLPEKMDLAACVPAKYWPILWLREMLIAALTEKENEVWEEAARVICHYCSQGLVWISDEDGVILHVEMSGKIWPCEAAALRKRNKR